MANLRLLLVLVAASLLGAAALHAGLVIPGPALPAAMYETAIAVILLVGLLLTFAGRTVGWVAALVAQAIALAGALVGLYLALIGVGPNTVPDVIYHVALIALLIVGLVRAWRLRQTPGTLTPSS